MAQVLTSNVPWMMIDAATTKSLAIEPGAIVDIVQQRGVTAAFVARPIAIPPPAGIRQSLIEEASRVLFAANRTARVTLGSTADDVVLSVVADGTAGSSGEGVRPDGVRTSTVTDETRTWVEAQWAPAPARRS